MYRIFSLPLSRTGVLNPWVMTPGGVVWCFPGGHDACWETIQLSILFGIFCMTTLILLWSSKPFFLLLPYSELSQLQSNRPWKGADIRIILHSVSEAIKPLTSDLRSKPKALLEHRADETAWGNSSWNVEKARGRRELSFFVDRSHRRMSLVLTLLLDINI